MKAPTLKRLPVLAACALLGGTVAANASPYVVTLQDTDNFGAVATGSGAIDLTGLEPNGNISFSVGGVQPNFAAVSTGPADERANSQYIIDNFVGPTSLGESGITFADGGSGDPVSVLGAFHLLLVPLGYVSDTPLSDTSTYSVLSVLDLGVAPGTYVWTWGPGADQSFTLDVVPPENLGTPATPLPATLPLFATGLGALGLLGWRRKRKARVSLLGAA